MGTQHLGHLLASRLLNHLHSLPEANRLPGVVARLRHHHQPNVIRLALLLAPHGEVVQQILKEEAARQRPDSKQRQAGDRPGQEEQAARREVSHPRGREPLRHVRRGIVRNLVPEHGRERVLVSAHVEDAAVHKDLAAGEDECVCRSCTVSIHA